MHPFFYLLGRKRYKNFRLLLQAFSKLEDIKDNFEIIFGGGKFLKEEINYMKELSLNPAKIKIFKVLIKFWFLYINRQWH